MTERKVYLGSIGPFLFDDDDDLEDADGDFSGEKMSAIVTDAPIHQTATPTSANEVVRLEDVTPGAGALTEDFRYSFMISSG